MILYPAIDLKDGQCVRLLHGDMNKATVFNASPADQAERFVRDGFDWLHVVDLNGAIEGHSMVIRRTPPELFSPISLPVCSIMPVNMNPILRDRRAGNRE